MLRVGLLKQPDIDNYNFYAQFQGSNDARDRGALTPHNRFCPLYRGGDEPEASLIAIQNMANQLGGLTWRTNAVKVMVLTTDAPFHSGTSALACLLAHAVLCLVKVTYVLSPPQFALLLLQVTLCSPTARPTTTAPCRRRWTCLRRPTSNLLASASLDAMLCRWISWCVFQLWLSALPAVFFSTTQMFFDMLLLQNTDKDI